MSSAAVRDPRAARATAASSSGFVLPPTPTAPTIRPAERTTRPPEKIATGQGTPAVSAGMTGDVGGRPPVSAPSQTAVRAFASALSAAATGAVG